MEKNNNLCVYNSVREVPAEAKREIRAGRLRGKTDINPMWRIKMLTEQFGVIGFGWKYTVNRQWLEPALNGEVKAFVNISLYIKMDGEWSDAIEGTGGSSFISNEGAGQYVNDECYKMATTDALSVACKQLGMGASVYWADDNTKYNDAKTEAPAPKKATRKAATSTPTSPAPTTQVTDSANIPDVVWTEINAAVLQCKTQPEIRAVHAAYPQYQSNIKFRTLLNDTYNKLKNATA